MQTISRPTHVSHRNLRSLVDQLTAAGRTELIHYAGASYRDLTAWEVCRAWLADRDADEPTLLSRAYAASGWGHITADDIRRARATCR